MKAAETTIPAWQMAVKNRPIEGRLIFHRFGDPVRQGGRCRVQYACHAFTGLLKKHPMVLQSMIGLPMQWERELPRRRSDGIMP